MTDTPLEQQERDTILHTLNERDFGTVSNDNESFMRAYEIESDIEERKGAPEKRARPSMNEERHLGSSLIGSQSILRSASKNKIIPFDSLISDSFGHEDADSWLFKDR